MNQTLLITLCGLLAAGASASTTLFVLRDDPGPSSSESGQVIAAPQADNLAAKIASLEEKQAELDRFLGMLSVEQDPSGVGAGQEREVAALVEAWLDEHAGDLVLNASGADVVQAQDLDPGLAAIREAEISDLVDLITDSAITGSERELAWQKIAAAGRLQEVVDELARMIELDPQDPDLRVTLGNAYLQQLFDGATGPMAGVLATKADEAFTTALSLDEGHWEARFMKAVSLSNWPAFLGKQGEAIAEFERLVDIQEEQSAEPQQAQTYLFLGNMYLETGDQPQALATWRRGLERFPASDELRRQIQINGGGR